MADELSAPLQPRKERLAARRRDIARSLQAKWPVARIALGLVALVLIAAAIRIAYVDDPAGGRPVAEAPINSTRNANPVAEQVATPSTPVTITADPGEFPASPSITVLGTPQTAEAAVSGGGPGALDPTLVEQTANGPIPRISAEGLTPFAAYARPSRGAAAGRPMIAIVVTGLGLNEATTLEAIAALPQDVTLAFAPYGRTLERTTAAARAEGHELLLEVPLEPFDYPDNDPGPQTLLTGHPPRSNLDKLGWLMGRFGGYVGLVNNMGARFTSSAPDFSPMIEELGARGLGYLDDGSSNRSVAPQLAGPAGVPYARGDILVDLTPSPAAIEATLAELEAKAGAGGSAIGIATALPVSIETISRWAEGLEARGFMLVPVSVLMRSNGG